jgi:dUTP diphosphatase
MNKDKVIIKVLRAKSAEDLDLPHYATPHSAGMDLLAAVDNPVILQPGDINLIPTGLRLAIPIGYEAQVRPRSGLALKHGITLPNSPGTIDSDYRGELGVIIQNGGREAFTINRGDRIAQLIIAPVVQAHLELVDELPDSERSEGGFGSTGV